tara:strand:+ start:247 stop:1641 length:1395 start_codon:yes stop_codon:yes gene_type:complete
LVFNGWQLVSLGGLMEANGFLIKTWFFITVLSLGVLALAGVAESVFSLSFVSDATGREDQFLSFFKIAISFFVFLVLYFIFNNSRSISLVYGSFSLTLLVYLSYSLIINLNQISNMVGVFELASIFGLIGLPYFIIKNFLAIDKSNRQIQPALLNPPFNPPTNTSEKIATNLKEEEDEEEEEEEETKHGTLDASFAADAFNTTDKKVPVKSSSFVSNTIATDQRASERTEKSYDSVSQANSTVDTKIQNIIDISHNKTLSRLREMAGVKNFHDSSTDGKMDVENNKLQFAKEVQTSTDSDEIAVASEAFPQEKQQIVKGQIEALTEISETDDGTANNLISVKPVEPDKSLKPSVSEEHLDQVTHQILEVSEHLQYAGMHYPEEIDRADTIMPQEQSIQLPMDNDEALEGLDLNDQDSQEDTSRFQSNETSFELSSLDNENSLRALVRAGLLTPQEFTRRTRKKI